MAAICYSDQTSAFPTNEQLVGKKYLILMIDITKTERLVSVYTDRLMDIAKSTHYAD